MQSEITIYSAATGEPIANALHEDGSVLRVELMKTDEMQLRFTLADAVAIGVGDYAVHPETRRRYVCSERYCPEYNSSTGGYSGRMLPRLFQLRRVPHARLGGERDTQNSKKFF